MPGSREILEKVESAEPRVQSRDQGRNSVSTSDTSRWQRGLAEAIRDLPTLLRRLQLEEEFRPAQLAAAESFPILVPESYLRRIRPGDAQDPLLLQVLPRAAEMDSVTGFLDDPVADHASRTAPGLLHKYQGRALLIAHGSCAVHCRYCFRRHFPYDQEPNSWAAWQPALEAIREDPSLHEIILSGGDPLILSDRRFRQLVEELADIPHLRRLRIHSRLPIVLPERISPALISLLKSTRLRTICVVHSNHARELVDDCEEALGQLVDSGLTVLNQAVLLRGVNDSVEALSALCERCVDLGVMPYYLHQLDRVRGAAHFEVPVETGRELVKQLRNRLPGYAVPKYVWEEPGAESKMPL